MGVQLRLTMRQSKLRPVEEAGRLVHSRLPGRGLAADRGQGMSSLRWLAIALLLSVPVYARDLDQWTNADPAVARWYESLM